MVVRVICHINLIKGEEKMLKKLLFFALILLVVAGCSSQDSGTENDDSSKKVKLEIMMFEGGFGSDWVEKSADKYMKDHSNVEIELIASPDISKQLQPRVVAGDSPDIINPGPKFDIKALMNNGGLLDLSDYLDTPAYDSDEKWGDTFKPGQLVLQKDASHYGIPILFSTGYLWWYDQKLFNDNNWDVPETWDDLYVLNEKAKAEGISTFALPGQGPAYSLYGLYLPLVQRMGGFEAIESGFNLEKGAWKSEPFLNAAKEIAKMREEEGMFLEGSMALSHIEAQTQFFQRNALFAMAGTWLEGEMQDVIPEDFELTALNQAPWSDGPAEQQKAAPVSSGWGGGWYVSKDSDHADEAIDFLKFLSSQGEMSEMVSSRGLPSTIKGTDEAIQSDTLKTALNVIDEAEGLTYIPTAINDSYPEFTINITNQIQALLLGEVSPEEFIDYAEKQAETLRNDDSIEKVEYKFGEK